MENKDDYVEISGKEMLQIKIDALTEEKESFKKFNKTSLCKIEALKTLLKSCDTLNQKENLLESATRLKIEFEYNPVPEKTIHKRLRVTTKDFKSDNIYGDMMLSLYNGLIKQTEDLIESIQHKEIKSVTETPAFNKKYNEKQLKEIYSLIKNHLNTSEKDFINVMQGSLFKPIIWTGKGVDLYRFIRMFCKQLDFDNDEVTKKADKNEEENFDWAESKKLFVLKNGAIFNKGMKCHTFNGANETLFDYFKEVIIDQN